MCERDRETRTHEERVMCDWVRVGANEPFSTVSRRVICTFIYNLLHTCIYAFSNNCSSSSSSSSSQSFRFVSGYYYKHYRVHKYSRRLWSIRSDVYNNNNAYVCVSQTTVRSTPRVAISTYIYIYIFTFTPSKLNHRLMMRPHATARTRISVRHEILLYIV